MALTKKVNGVEVVCGPAEEQAILNEWAANAEPPTAAELDAVAEKMADQMLEQDAKMKALGLVMADLVQASFNLSQSEARQEVKTRFRDYYRALL